MKTIKRRIKMRPDQVTVTSDLVRAHYKTPRKDILCNDACDGQDSNH